jgi:hypothetical protein
MGTRHTQTGEKQTTPTTDTRNFNATGTPDEYAKNAGSKKPKRPQLTRQIDR